MDITNEMNTRPPAASCSPILTLGGRVSQRTTLTVLGVATVGAGLLFGWNSLAALGLTGLIVSLLPCLIMCAAGICMGRMGKEDPASSAVSTKT